MPAHLSFARRVFLTVLIVASLHACTTIEIRTTDGSIEVERHLGVLSIELQPNRKEQVLSASGIGLISDGRQFILGYHDIELAVLGSDCHIVLWIENEAQISAAYKLLGDPQELCVFHADKGRGE